VNGLGAVSIDVHKKERDFKHLTLSDANVVKYLILFRSKVDVGYNATTNIDINQAGDLTEMNQELIALYSSLDEIVKKSALTKKQSAILEMLYEGNTIKDISELTSINRVSTYRVLDRIVGKVVEANNEDWYYTVGNNGFVLKKD
jgi:hypothetical protein